VKIPNDQVAERIAFQTEIRFEVLFRGVTDRKVANGSEQNWSMENDQECRANSDPK
jgi:hypothetical protein